MESILEDEDAMVEGVADKLKKRKLDDANKDEGPSAGSDRGLKRQKTSKDTEPSKKAKSTETSKGTGPTFNLLKGTCKSHVELEYNIEECYKAVTDRLDWNNHEGKEYPFDLSKPLPLIIVQGRQVVPIYYFINNDLEFLRGGSSSKKYTTFITKTKAAKYDILGIEDMVPSLWIPVKCPKEILATETQLQLPAPRPVANPLRTGNPDKYCDYHQDKDHHTNDCIQLRKQLEIALESGKLNHLMKDLRQRVGRGQGRNPPPPPKVINMVGILSSKEKKRRDGKGRKNLDETPYHLPRGLYQMMHPMNLNHRSDVEGLKALHAIPSTIHSMIRFPTPKGIATLVTRATIIAECRLREGKQILTEKQPEIHEARQPDEGADLTEQDQLKTLLTNNLEVFAWEPADMTGVPRRIIEHSLNVNPSLEPFCQKRRTFSPEKSEAVTNEVAEWVRAGIVRPVKYPTYISNPVLVKKCDGSWRMCIDFKNLNSACPKDYYPLPSIDCKVEAVMGFKYKCFLDAYKGYHQIQMAREDEEKTAFYTEQGTYCYMKMPFGLKNAGATYQRLVDSTFQSQIGRNLEAYVDDMVIKSKDEKDSHGRHLQKTF
ncbi:reverse transcriptase domain-containing protein [Tanacetum coccineum]